MITLTAAGFSEEGLAESHVARIRSHHAASAERPRWNNPSCRNSDRTRQLRCSTEQLFPQPADFQSQPDVVVQDGGAFVCIKKS